MSTALSRLIGASIVSNFRIDVSGSQGVQRETFLCHLINHGENVEGFFTAALVNNTYFQIKSFEISQRSLPNTHSQLRTAFNDKSNAMEGSRANVR
jgi:hypothetical protein